MNHSTHRMAKDGHSARYPALRACDSLERVVRLTWWLLFWALCLPAHSPSAETQVGADRQAVARQLVVSPTGHSITYAAGRPFFYLADTAWELFHRLNREEADDYLKDRAGRGFTVIQAVVLAELDGLTVPNPDGQLPLNNNDPTQPNEAYFRHVDYIVERAESLGLYIGMLPTWGDKWNKKWGAGPEIFTPENAEQYGTFLANRYRDRAIIWILGGDRNPENEQHLAIVRALARGIRCVHEGKQLMTYHPQGGSDSSQWFHADPWLDFNMLQSGHSRKYTPNYLEILKDYELTPTKPVVDGEPNYEDHPIGWKPENGWFNDADVRRSAYWAMLTGAAGHTYGNHNIWQMWQPGRAPISAARTPWRRATLQPGATQMGYLRKLFESRDFQSLVPDASLIVGSPGSDAAHICAAVAKAGDFAFVYLPLGQDVAVRTDKLTGQQLRVWWYDPRQGKVLPGGNVARDAQVSLNPPGEPKVGNDWLLVIEDAAMELAPPGQATLRGEMKDR